MINYSAGAAIRQLEAEKAATGFLHFFESLETSHEDAHDLAGAKDELTNLIKTGNKKAQELGKIIDKHYRFDDER